MNANSVNRTVPEKGHSIGSQSRVVARKYKAYDVAKPEFVTGIALNIVRRSLSATCRHDVRELPFQNRHTSTARPILTSASKFVKRLLAPSTKKPNLDSTSQTS